MEGNRAEQQLRKIIQKYIHGTASEEEMLFLEMYYEEFEKEEDVLKGMSAGDVEAMKGRLKNGIASQVFEKEGRGAKVVRMQNWKRWVRVAAVAGVIFATGIWIYQYQHKTRSGAGNLAGAHQSSLQNDIAPGGNKAILTLADGSKIILDSANNGAITKQGNMTVIKLNDGEITYSPETRNLKPETVAYNTITTPRGGQYQLVLADGSKVWLNAASSLTYPTAFAGKERKVTLTGEGYFEVAHDATKPFKVDVAGKEEVEVLGTHFNVNAYGDESFIKTTLLQGSVKVNAHGQSAMLKPGEQAQLETRNAKLGTTDNVDLDQVVAWKDGYFSFQNANLEEVLRQISRWYDVEVFYEGDIPKRTFAGAMQRSLSLSQVLKLLVQNKINFEVEGKKIIVKP